MRVLALPLRLLALAVSPHGRITRATYLFSLPVLLVFCGIVTNTVALGFGLSPAWGEGGEITFYGTTALMVWPLIALTTKRAHDLGVTGLIAPLLFVPYLSWVVQLALIFVRGPQRPVRYWPFKSLHA